MPSNRKVTIDADTARYYLRLEAAFNGLCEGLQIDPNQDLGFDQNQRYQFRCDLHDNWARAASKPEPRKSLKAKEIF